MNLKSSLASPVSHYANGEAKFDFKYYRSKLVADFFGVTVDEFMKGVERYK